MVKIDCDDCDVKYTLVAVKRDWVPNFIFSLFSYYGIFSGFGMWNPFVFKPLRWVLVKDVDHE